MSRRLVLAVLAGLLFPGASQADTFQFVDDRAGAVAAYAHVQVDGQFVGFTDLYGRIDIATQQTGPHTATIRFLGRVFQLQLNITGDQKKLTVVHLTQ